ncbi:MAG: SpoVA/SpoVAEb family sporulation membrane protein [Clostridiaceae bacterium]|jgi:stage V sporulation protein AC|nr:SpoVA/SpoVAEb family sporulation membrane protein [Clostridiaceae bacterium]
MIEAKAYQEYVKQSAPKTKMMSTLLKAFLTGGIICCTGQAVADIIKVIIPDMSKENIGAFVSITLVFLSALLTGIGVYDRIGRFGGAGSLIPITGFANAVVAPAMEYNREGVVFGICSKMFVIAGPVIVFGVVAGVIAGIIGLFI